MENRVVTDRWEGYYRWEIWVMETQRYRLPVVK